mmetsp:Transcript_122745/g.393133  ORF Transcript_122745/g.393133 Transcript_122745/m.393133 type:complete len:232 (-) Transcript_122745:1162-1857(-)
MFAAGFVAAAAATAAAAGLHASVISFARQEVIAMLLRLWTAVASASRPLALRSRGGVCILCRLAPGLAERLTREREPFFEEFLTDDRRRCRPGVRLDAEQPLEQRPQRASDRRTGVLLNELWHRLGVGHDHGAQDAVQLPHEMPSDELVENAAEGPNVRGLAVARRRQHFGGHVAIGARVREGGGPDTGVARVLAQAEIAQPHAAVLSQEDVLGLQVAMDDVLAVQVLDRL